MDKKLAKLLTDWKLPLLRDWDLQMLFQERPEKWHDAVRTATSKGYLIHLRRGVYLIGSPYRRDRCHPFEAAQTIYGPSYISFESALSYHGWIPEAVYCVVSATTERSKTFKTPLATFEYLHTPRKNFFANVMKEGDILIAEPWKAIADMIYDRRKTWSKLADLSDDMRIELETMLESDRESLFQIATCYPSARVRAIMSRFYEELV